MRRSLIRLASVLALWLILDGQAVSAFIPVCDECNINFACDQVCWDTVVEEYTICGVYTDWYCQSQSPLEEPVEGDPVPVELQSYPNEWDDLDYSGAQLLEDIDSFEAEAPVNEGGSAAYWDTEAQNPGMPPCNLVTKLDLDNTGTVIVFSPTQAGGGVQWGVVAHKWYHKMAIWSWEGQVNGVRKHNKYPSWELYEPHASLPASVAPSGSKYTLAIAHSWVTWQAYCGYDVQVKYGGTTIRCIVR